MTALKVFRVLSTCFLLSASQAADFQAEGDFCLLSLDPNYVAFNQLSRAHPAAAPPASMTSFQGLFQHMLKAHEKVATMSEAEQVVFFNQLLERRESDFTSAEFSALQVYLARRTAREFRRRTQAESGHLNTALRKIVEGDDNALLLLGVEWRCNERELQVMRLHNFSGMNFADIAVALGSARDANIAVSTQRMRQLYLSGTRKLRESVSYVYLQNPYNNPYLLRQD